MNDERSKKLDSLFEAFSIIAEGKYVYLCDMKQDLSRWSDTAVDYFGLPGIYMKNAGAIWEAHIHPDDRAHYAKSIAAIFSGEESGHDMQYRAIARDGSYAVCTCRGVVIRDPDGNPDYFAGVIQNHGMLSYIDTATGLRSLYGFFDDLASMFWKQDQAAILLVGLTGFSNINDIYGYSFGNSVLRALANVLQKKFANNGLVYRMDGTKFAVISHTLSAAQLCDLYRKLQAEVSHQFYVEDKLVSMSLNAGVVNVDNFDISTKTVYSCLR